MLEKYKQFNKLPKAWPLIIRHLEWNLTDNIIDVLDVGCRVGTTVLKLKQMGYNPVGIDINKKYVEVAQQYTGCIVLEMNAEYLTFDDGSFAFILCTETLEHISNHMAVLNEFYRVLKPNGRIFISVPNPYHIPRMVYPEHFVAAELINWHVSVNDLTQWLALFKISGFKVVSWTGHPNRWIFPRWKRIGILLDKIIGKRLNRFKQNLFFELKKE